jgi:hypothetical protein
MDHVETGWEYADWINMAEDRDRWRAVVNTIFLVQSGYLSYCQLVKRVSYTEFWLSDMSILPNQLRKTGFC